MPLAELCATLDIPVKTSTHGSEVGALWRAGDTEGIARYVEEDVLATYLVWLSWAAFRANDEHKIVEPLADLAAWLERRSDLAHLHCFAGCPPTLQARQRAMFHRVAASPTDAWPKPPTSARSRANARSFDPSRRSPTGALPKPEAIHAADSPAAWMARWRASEGQDND